MKKSQLRMIPPKKKPYWRKTMKLSVKKLLRLRQKGKRRLHRKRLQRRLLTRRDSNRRLLLKLSA